MGTKGKKKTPKKGPVGTTKIAQQKALEFDARSRSDPNFKKEIVSLREEFTGKKDISFFRWISERSSGAERKAINTYLAGLEIPHANVFTPLDSKLLQFMSKYSLPREWLTSLRYLVLTGEYIVPDANYFLQKDPVLADSVLISVNRDTSDPDILLALYDAKKMLVSRRYEKEKAGSYSSVEDPDFIDAGKKTEAYYLNIGQLTGYEHELYKKAKSLADAERDIYEYRKKQRKSKVAMRPKFIKQISDREYFKSTGLKGDALTRALERLKKARQKYSKRSA